MERSSSNNKPKNKPPSPAAHPRTPGRILPLQQRQGPSTVTSSSNESSSSTATDVCSQKRHARDQTREFCTNKRVRFTLPVQENPTASRTESEESMDNARKRKTQKEAGPSLSSCYTKLVDIIHNHPSPLLIPGGNPRVLEELPPALSVEDDSIKKKNPIEIPTRVDVLFGRGMCYYNHLGNWSFRQIAALYGPAYCSLPRSNQPKLAKNLVQYIRWQGGRFLMREGNDDDSPWYECGNEKARLKMSQGLRDATKNSSKLPGSAIPLSSYYSKFLDVIPNHPSPLLCPCIRQKDGSFHPPPPAVAAAAAEALPLSLLVNDDSIKQEHPIRNPSSVDVLLGRGTIYCNHLGNRLLLLLTECYRSIYCEIPITDRPRLVQNLVQYIRWQGGRFLIQQGNSKHDDDDGGNDLSWYECGDKQARKKVSQRLRDSQKMFKKGTATDNSPSR